MKPRPIRSLLLTFVSTISTFTLFALPWVASAQSAADYRRMAQAERDKARSVGGSQGEIYLRAADAYENAARQREGLEDRKRDQEQKTRDLSEKLQSLQLNNAAATRNLNKANSLNSARDTFNKGLNDLGEILIRRQQEQAEKAEREDAIRQMKEEEQELRKELAAERKRLQDDERALAQELKQATAAAASSSPGNGVRVIDYNKPAGHPDAPPATRAGVRVLDYNQPARLASPPPAQPSAPAPTPAPARLRFDAAMEEFATPPSRSSGGTVAAPAPANEQYTLTERARAEAARMRRFGDAVLGELTPVVQETGRTLADGIMDQAVNQRPLSVLEAARGGVNGRLRQLGDDLFESLLNDKQKEAVRTLELFRGTGQQKILDREISPGIDEILKDVNRDRSR